MRPLCPIHRQPLAFDERYEDSVPDGLGGLGTERTFVVERFACVVSDCTETQEYRDQ